VSTDDHQCTLAQLNINTACCIGEYQRFDPEELERPDRKSHLFEAVALVVMHAPLHRYDRDIGDLANDQATRVTLGRGGYKTWNLLVRNLDRVCKLFGEGAEATAQHEGNLCIRPGARRNSTRCVFSPRIKIHPGLFF
jgi:hypothetical protein